MFFKKINNQKDKEILLSELEPTNQSRRLVAHLHCYYGELAELKEKQGRGSVEKN